MRALPVALAFAALSACATPSTSTAPSRAVASTSAATSYIGAAHLDAAAFLDPPPDAASARAAGDLAAVKAAQAAKGTERWALAQHDDESSPFSAFDMLGPKFTGHDVPRLAALFAVLFDDAHALSAPAKKAFARPRPPLVDPSIETCKPLEKTGSYPSGHAMRGWLMALVLAEMLPERADALLARGRDYGDSRVVCAEHFPSDVEAGRALAGVLLATAWTDPRFAGDFASARAELRAVLAAP